MGGAKGEKRFPDFEASEVQGLNQKIRSIFSNNQDVLHYCGEAECDEDYRGLLSGRQYRESREYSNPELQVQIYYRFLTRVWTEDIERYIADFHLLTGNRIGKQEKKEIWIEV